MRFKTILAVVSASTILVGMSAFAVEVKSSDNAAMMSGGMMNMSVIMQSCMKHCQATSAAIDETVKSIDAAKDTDDVAKLKAELVEARRQLTDMKFHMTECMGMMEKMQGVHGTGGSPSGKPVDGLVKAYLRTDELLVEDKFNGVAAQFQMMRESATELSKSDNPKVAEPAKQITSASKEPGDIDAARSQLKQISKSVLLMVEVSPPSSTIAPALYEVYCPMAKASWLQVTKGIANPYMGKSMPECGKVKRTIEPMQGAGAHQHEHAENR